MSIKKIIQLIEQDQLSDAIDELKKKLKRSPADVKILNMLGMLCIRIDNKSEGLNYFEKSLLINGNQIDVFWNIVSGYQETQQIKKAISLIEKNIGICNDQLLFKLGYFYNADNQFKKAVDVYLSLLKSKEVDQKALHYNLAISYENNKNFNDAIKAYKESLKIDNNFYQASFNLAILYLYSNKFELGWQLFESRLKFKQNKIEIQKPILKKIETVKKNILLFFEYGIGDQVLFSTFLASMDLKANNYFIKIDQRLHELIKEKYYDIKIYESKYESIIDFIIPIASLGGDLRPSIKSFDNINYGFNLDEKKINSIKKLLPKNKILCGISWKSSNKELGQFKKINIDKILSGINIKDIAFVNLQYNSTEEELQEINKSIKSEIIDLNFDKFNDIEQLACLISCCNFVITTSNITAHLAGIINKDTLVIPPKIHGKLWYWGNHKERISLWYKNVKIIDNSLNIGDGEILNQIKDHLKIH